jgi:predicted N-acetyltransferase YhbS
MAKKLPREIPGFSLARLAVREDLKGQHLGEYLLFHALDRAARVAGEIGGYAAFVDAKNADGAAFYKKYGITSFPDNPLILCLPVKDIPK